MGEREKGDEKEREIGNNFFPSHAHGHEGK